MSGDSEEFTKGTSGLLLRFFLLAFLVPLLVLATVYAYSYFSGVEFTRGEWKTVTLLTWLGALLILGLDAFRSSRS